MGKGASNISIKGFGKIGTKAKHHLNGCKRAFRPKIADERLFCLPTNIIDCSNKIAENSLSKVVKGNLENKLGQNH